MSDADKDRDDQGQPDDQTLAGEFVLGGQPAALRAELQRRVETDAAFARLVADWERRLLPLADDFVPHPPPAAVKRSLDLLLFGQAPRPSGGIWASLALWRGLAAAAVAGFLLAVAMPAPRPVAPQAERLVASLAADGSGVSYLALYDAARGSVSLTRIAGDPVAGRDFQLWVLRGTDAPVSVGVLPVAGSATLDVGDRVRDLLVGTSRLAISLEPEGGSPTGRPTGPVVAAGSLVGILSPVAPAKTFAAG